MKVRRMDKAGLDKRIMTLSAVDTVAMVLLVPAIFQLGVGEPLHPLLENQVLVWGMFGLGVTVTTLTLIKLIPLWRARAELERSAKHGRS